MVWMSREVEQRLRVVPRIPDEECMFLGNLGRGKDGSTRHEPSDREVRIVLQPIHRR